MFPMSAKALDPSVALEITISEPLFRRLQAALDADPTLSLDDLANKALTVYLALLSLQSSTTD